MGIDYVNGFIDEEDDGVCYDCHNTPGCKWTSSMTIEEQRDALLNDDLSFDDPEEESPQYYPRKPLGHYSTVFIVINALAGLFIIILVAFTLYCYVKAFTNVANNNGYTFISDSTPLIP